MKLTQTIYDTLHKYDLKPDARIQQRYMDHSKVTEKKNKLAEEQKKKLAKKEKTTGGASVGSKISLAASIRATNISNSIATRAGTTTTTGGLGSTMVDNSIHHSSSIINDRDARAN
jgi:hypothetical protein